MELKNKKIMDEFGEENLPSLSTCVLGALELFASEGLPEVKIPNYNKPIIMGSGNAIVAARLLYGDMDAIFADENNYKKASEREHDGVVIFSGSGEKHAKLAALYFKEKGTKTTLVTSGADSSAAQVVGSENVVATPKNREPYTYNTSTYMGWIFAKTRENPREIWQFINDNIASKFSENVGEFGGYLLVTPQNFSRGNRLFEVKFVELFGRRVARDVRTYEEVKHAITVVPWERELCIKFGEGEVDFANSVMEVPLPENAGPAAIMAIGYYVIGKIQEGKPQWFKENIGEYVAKMNRTDFGKGLKVIVD